MNTRQSSAFEDFRTLNLEAQSMGLIALFLRPFLRILYSMFMHAKDDWQGRPSRSRSREPIRRSSGSWREDRHEDWWKANSSTKGWRYDDVDYSSTTPSKAHLPVDEKEWTPHWDASSWRSSPNHEDQTSSKIMALNKTGMHWTHVSIPSNFRPNEEYWDERIVFDLPLPRTVFCTEWSTSAEIAGLPITSIPLYKILYKGLSNWCLRYLGAGKACYMIMTRSYQQSIVLYSLSKALRTVDIERVAKTWNSSLSQPHPDDDKKILEMFGEHLATLVQQPSDTKLYERVQSLEKELSQTKFEKQSNGKPGPSAAVQQSVPAPPPAVNPADAALHFLAKFERGTKAKHLSTDAPISAGTKDINSWSKRVLTGPLSKKVPAVVNEIKENLKQVHDDQTDFVLRVLIEWGLPVSTAGSLTLDSAVKVLAVVSMLGTK